MKISPAILVTVGAGALASCDSNEEPPKAVVVEQQEVAASETDRKLEKTMEEMQAEFDRMPPPDEPGEASLPVVEPEPVEVERTTGERVDDVIDSTARGLRTAGEKTGEGLETAVEKTGEGLQDAAGATGRFLQRAGEKIEEAAGE